MENTQKNVTWQSSTTFTLAAMGAAIGLGNLWRFPYLVGTNGGGAFIFVFLLALVFVATPVLILELLIGRNGKTDAAGSISIAAEQSEMSSRWAVIGWIGIIASFLILSLYSVVVGWTFYYLFSYIADTAPLTPEASVDFFASMNSNPFLLLSLHTLVLSITALIVMQGINKGIEKAASYSMPVLFILLVALAIYACVIGDFEKTRSFLFSPDFENVKSSTIIMAVGQAFFTVGVGYSTMITYGAYVGESTNIRHCATHIVLADTLAAMLAGFAIFPIVFANNLDISEGAGLAFISLPIAFSTIPAGQLVAIAFFTLFVLAAMTSMIGVLEPAVTLIKTRLNVSRRKATLLASGFSWLIGMITVISFSSHKDFFPLDNIDMFRGANLFDIVDYFNVSIMVPGASLLFVIMAGFYIGETRLNAMFGETNIFTRLWFRLIKYIIPPALLLIILAAILSRTNL